MNEKLKKLVIDIAVVLVIPAALFYLASTFELGTSLLLGSVQPGAELVGEGEKFLSKLKQLESLKFDTSVFDSPTYKSLVDSTIAPPTEAQGRPNPFIPPGSSSPTPPAATGAKNTGSTVQNLNTLLR